MGKILVSCILKNSFPSLNSVALLLDQFFNKNLLHGFPTLRSWKGDNHKNSFAELIMLQNIRKRRSQEFLNDPNQAGCRRAAVRISGLLITLLANMGYKSLLFPFFYREKNFSINKHVIAKFFFFSFAKKSANCQAPHEAPLKTTQKGHFKKHLFLLGVHPFVYFSAAP